METFIPPHAGQTRSTAKPATSTSGIGTVIRASDAASQSLKTSHTLEGKVVDQPRPGQVTVDTAQGRVTIETPARLPQGATVTIEPKGGDAYQQVRLHIHSSPPAVTAKPIQLPPQVSTNLSNGQAVQAQVTGTNAQGQITLQTAEGRNLTLESQAPLPKGTTVTLTQTGSGTNTQIRLQPHPTPAPAPVGTPTPPPAVTAKPIQLPSQVSTNLSNGQAVQAQVTGNNAQGQLTLQTAEGRNLTLEAQAPLPKGTTVTLTQTGSGTNTQIRLQPHPTPAPTPVSTPTPPPAVTAKPIQLPPQVSTNLSNGQAVQAQVTGNNAQGQLTLQTAEGRNLTLEAQAPLPKGTTVTLTQTGSGTNTQIRLQPHPTPAPVSTPTPPPAVTAKPIQLPPQVSTNLSNGQAVQAQVTGTNTQGQITLQTAQGKVTLETLPGSTLTALPKGTAVTVTQTVGGPSPVVTIQPQTPASAVATTTTNPQSLTATSTQLPPQVSTALTQGQVLSGTVTGSPGQGQLTLQTSHGPITLTSNQTLPAGTTVNISLASTSGSTTTLQLIPQSTPPVLGDGGSILTNLTLGTRFTATILAAQAGRTLPSIGSGGITGQAQPTTGGPVPTGQATGPTANMPQISPTPTGADATAGAGRSANGTPQPPGSSQQTQAQSQTLPSGHSLPVRLVGLTLPGQAPLTLPEPLPAGQFLLSGTVTASGGGQTTVQTASGNLSLPTAQTLPVGSILQMAILGPPQPLSDIQSMASMFSVERWQALSDAVTLLQAGDIGTAQRLLQLVPQNTPQLGNALLFLFSALRIGSAERWVGKDILRSLDQMRAGSAAKLGDSVQSAQTRIADSAGQDWKVFHMPFLSDSELEELRLYLKDREAEEEDPESPEDEDQRFVIEANFTRLGPMQFDGFSRKKQFDLMIRTHDALPGEMRDDIRGLFTNAVSALGITGTVGFHVTEKFDVSVEEQQKHHRGGVTV